MLLVNALILMKYSASYVITCAQYLYMYAFVLICVNYIGFDF